MHKIYQKSHKMEHDLAEKVYKDALSLSQKKKKKRKQVCNEERGHAVYVLI